VNRRGDTVRRLGVLIASSAAGFVLVALGHGALAAPPTSSLDALTSWAADRSSFTAALALVRLAAVGGAGYVAAVMALGLVARAAGWRPAIRLADAVTAPGLRRAVASAGLGVSVLAFAAPAGAEPAPTGPPPIIRLDATGGQGAATGASAHSVVTMHRLPDEGSDPVGTATAGTPVPVPTNPAPAPTWTVGPGDNLWLIAHETVAVARTAEPDDTDVAAYWRALIEANRDRLPDPGNPDLLFSGTVLVLPAVAPEP
jgi:nucleoid-associated protein YgaU